MGVARTYPSSRETFKPFILCFKCRGNILDCQCRWSPGQEPKWVTERKQEYVAKNAAVKDENVSERRAKMRFSFGGKQFAIDFRREFKQLRREDAEGQEAFVNSKYPSTTVNILELDPTEKGSIKNAKVFATATVSCWSKEPVFSLEKGRQRALRNVTRTLPKEMKPLVWFTYMNRKKDATPIPPIPHPAS